MYLVATNQLCVAVSRVTINREKLLEKAYSFLMGTSAKVLRRSRCNISWSGEAG